MLSHTHVWLDIDIERTNAKCSMSQQQRPFCPQKAFLKMIQTFNSSAQRSNHFSRIELGAIKCHYQVSVVSKGNCFLDFECSLFGYLKPNIQSSPQMKFGYF